VQTQPAPHVCESNWNAAQHQHRTPHSTALLHAYFPAFCLRSLLAASAALSARVSASAAGDDRRGEAILRRFSAGELSQRTRTLACLGWAFPLRGCYAARVWFVRGVLRSCVTGFDVRELARSLARPRPFTALFCPYAVLLPCGGGCPVGSRFRRCTGAVSSISRWCGRIVCHGVGDLWRVASNDLGFRACSP
jgi:hypothetical protein